MDFPLSEVRRSSKLLGECDRRGYVELYALSGDRSVILPTTCKTWGCIVCRTKLLGLFKARVELGVSNLGPCAFITITYLADSARLLDASCVQKDWQALLRNLKRRGNQWSWLKVTELTKQGIPHHHVVLGPVTQQIRCHGPKIRKGAETARYLARMATCPCMAHEFARVWWRLTGDSFICFATPVTDPIGAAGYMAKYMLKEFLRDNRTGRRFSTSRCWPGGTRMRLRVTLEEGWAYIRLWPGSRFNSNIDYNAEEQDLLERVGEDLTAKILERGRRRAAAAYFRKVLTP